MRAWEFMRPAAGMREGDNTMQPEGSLDAAQRRSIRLADAQRKMRDEASRRAAKLRDPKSRLP
jgi:hypothetical protein